MASLSRNLLRSIPAAVCDVLPPFPPWQSLTIYFDEPLRFGIDDFSVVAAKLQPFSSGHSARNRRNKGGVARVTRGECPVSSSSALWLGVGSEIWVTEPRLTLRATVHPVTCCVSNGHSAVALWRSWHCLSKQRWALRWRWRLKGSSFS